MIKLESLCKTYSNGTAAVKNLSFNVDNGEICILLGPSGCGKSTTLRMINRLIEPSSGQIYVNGKSIFDCPAHELRRQIGYAIQEVALFPHMTVAENISVVPRLLGWPAADQHRRVLELLDLIGLDPDKYKDKYPCELSGGEQQRIGVARAMGANPPVLLMDEPFGAIDPITRSRLQDELLRIQETVRKTIIFVTHDINEALKLGDKIALLREGTLVQFGTPREIVTSPANSFVRDFMGSEHGMLRLRLIPVEEIMLRNPIVASIREKPMDVLAKLLKNGLRQICVVDTGGQLLGLVQRSELEDKRPQSLAQVLRPAGEYVEKKTTVLDSYFRLFIAGTDSLPVIDNKSRLLGLITADIMDDCIRQGSNAVNRTGKETRDARTNY